MRNEPKTQEAKTMTDSDFKDRTEALSKAVKDLSAVIQDTIEAIEQMQRAMAQTLEEASSKLLEFTVTIDVPEIEFIYPDKQRRRTYPPYRERLHGRTGWQRKTFWNRVRSNPKRKRKPH